MMSTETDHETPTVTLISPFQNLQASILANAISQKLRIRCPITDLSQYDQDCTAFALVDCQNHRRLALDQWLHKRHHSDNTPNIALFNVTPHSEHEQLLSWPSVYGIFFTTSSQEMIIKGIQQLLKGEYWLPRRLLHEFLQSHRRPPKINPLVQKITKREKQILCLIRESATNAEIASHLFVSEHTVKSHLYNLYKKIGVRNRLEACNWARRFMATQSISED